MRVNDGFRAFVLEQPPGVESVPARAMLVGSVSMPTTCSSASSAADALYLKVDDSTRGQYEAALVASSQPPR